MVYLTIHSVNIEEIRWSQFSQGGEALAFWGLPGLAALVYPYNLSSSFPGRMGGTLPLRSYHFLCLTSMGPNLNVIQLHYIIILNLSLFQTMSSLGIKTLHLFILPSSGPMSGSTQWIPEQWILKGKDVTWISMFHKGVQITFTDWKMKRYFEKYLS